MNEQKSTSKDFSTIADEQKKIYLNEKGLFHHAAVILYFIRT